MAIVSNVSFSDGGGGNKGLTDVRTGQPAAARRIEGEGQGLTDVQTGRPTAVRRIDVDASPRIDHDEQEISDIMSIASGGGSTGYRPVSAVSPFHQGGPAQVVAEPVPDPTPDAPTPEPIFSGPDEPDFQDKIRDIFNNDSKDIGDKIKDIFKETVSETKENIHDIADSFKDKIDDIREKMGLDTEEKPEIGEAAVAGATAGIINAARGHAGASAVSYGMGAGAAAGATMVDREDIGNNVAEAVAAGASAQQIQDMINSGDVGTARAVQNGIGGVQNVVDHNGLDGEVHSLMDAVGAPDIAPEPEPESTTEPLPPEPDVEITGADHDVEYDNDESAKCDPVDLDFDM